jgi:hypothetical protein
MAENRLPLPVSLAVRYFSSAISYLSQKKLGQDRDGWYYQDFCLI